VELARSFGRAAADYERGRPGWPQEAVDSFGLPRAATVLDLAAGTGKLTRVLVSRFARVIAVEPSDAMRAVLEEAVPDAVALAGSAEAIPLADRSVNAAFVADAFHWFGTCEIVAEVARVLRPRGILALMWFGRTVRVTPPLPDAFTRRIGQLREALEAHPYEEQLWRSSFDGSRFEPLRQRTFQFEHLAGRDAMVALALSSSWIASLPDRERASIRDELLRVLPEESYRRMLSVNLEWTQLARAAADKLAPTSRHAR
jgi:ubiquinone/menaquinone biosynthesis C-methylase UbiE